MNTIRLLSRRAALFAIGLAVGGFMLAGQALAVSEIYVLDGQAIKGYDTVAYFTDGKAVKGNPLFKHTWKGADWIFASAANRDLFARDPEKYAPQFGGYCAWGMTVERAVVPNPELFKVVDGKLYLQSGEGAMNNWLKDVPAAITKAATAWPKVKTQ